MFASDGSTSYGILIDKGSSNKFRKNGIIICQIALLYRIYKTEQIKYRNGAPSIGRCTYEGWIRFSKISTIQQIDSNRIKDFTLIN